VTNLLGAVASLEGEGWQIHLNASRNTDVQGAVFSAHTQHYTAGYRYDRHHIVSWGEYGYEQSPDGTVLTGGQTYMGQSKGGYVLVGYRIGDFLPRYTYADGNYNLGIYTGENTSHIFGLNYQMSTQAVVKAEYQVDLIPSGTTGYPVQTSNGSSSGSALYVGLDFIF
jgi:hypothetical protein